MEAEQTTTETVPVTFSVDASGLAFPRPMLPLGELEEKSTCAKIAQVREEGNRNVRREILYYNLDVIISVGYRVNSHRGTQFRIWATQQLKEYLIMKSN